jgi:hypothetical protein
LKYDDKATRLNSQGFVVSLPIWARDFSTAFSLAMGLTPRLRMCGAVPPLLYVSLWHGV